MACPHDKAADCTTTSASCSPGSCYRPAPAPTSRVAGPVAWLGEVDCAIARGQNLKLTVEWFDPDRDVSEDKRVRYSAVYEWTPVPFLQLRGGARLYDDIPQSDPDNWHTVFVETHGLF